MCVCVYACVWVCVCVCVCEMQTNFSLQTFSIQGVQIKTEPIRCVYWYIKNVYCAWLFILL
jgi:hypothetical protein